MRRMIPMVLNLGGPRGGGGLALDDLVTSAAFSVDRLYSAYAGDCMLLRRSSDDAERAFGFAANTLDTAAISAWGGADTLYVKTWYDQSGNTRDASQATAGNQTTLVLDQLNGKPVVRFVGATGQWLATATTPALAQPNTVLMTAKVTDPKVAQTYLDSTTDAGQIVDVPGALVRRFRLFAGAALQADMARATTAYRVLDAQFNGATSTLYVDGRSHASGNAGATGFAGISIGKRGGATPLYLTGDVAELIVANAGWSLAQRAAIHANQQAAFGTYLKQLVFDGDSLTAGTGSTGGQTYPVQCGALLPAKTVVNVAIAGQDTAALLTNTNVYAYGGLVLDDVYILWIGINDLLNSVAEATVYANITNLATQRVMANFAQVMVCTLPDCQGTGRPVGFDAARAALNTLITEGAAANGYTVADLAADARLQNALDTTYFAADKTHLVNAGYGVVAGIVAAAITV